ncbi:hypothetical protein Tco_1018907 [Tanacetum coccineum]|uniref:Uncharacterized protein n=1 Tax=Tanacetum coccineum TaxID=301880 RepID=A0ABQ5FVP0_9ASTR
MSDQESYSTLNSFIPTQYQLDDIFTKPLDEPTFKRLSVELALGNSKVFFSTPTGGIYGEVGVNTFRNAIGAHYLPHSSEYVAPPSIDIVRPWFETIRYWETVVAKGTLKKSLLPPRRRLLMAQIIQCLGGTKPGAKPGHKKHSTSSTQPSVSSKEATKGGSSEAPTGSKTGHFKKRKESSSAMDSNPSQSPVSTPIDTGLHKEDQQATGDPTSLGVTNKARANLQLSSECDASADSTTESDPGLSSPSDFFTSITCKGLETILTQPIIGKGSNSIAKQIEKESSSTIKLEDLANLVSHVQLSFKDMDSPEDDLVIVVDDSDEDEDDEVHATKNVETEDTLVPKSASPKSSQIQELTNQVLILQSQKYKLELEKNKAEAEVALLKAQPFFPNLNDLTKEVKGLKKQVHDLEIKLPRDLKEIPTKLDNFTKNVTSLTSQVAELNTL